jgi:hypothetical protein
MKLRYLNTTAIPIKDQKTIFLLPSKTMQESGIFIMCGQGGLERSVDRKIRAY